MRRLRIPGLILAALGLSAVFWRRALSTGEQTGFGDWQFFHHMWEVARVGILRDGALPLWNPHHCGGLTYFGNPQSQAFSPLFPLAFAIGTAWASKVFLVVHTTIALVGAYRLAESRLGVRPLAAAIGATIWSLSGFFAWHGGGGHAAFLPFAFAPWALCAVGRVRDAPRAAAALAAWMALCLLEGGVYPTLFVGVLVALDVVAASARRVPARALAAMCGGALLLFLLAAAVRLLPIAVQLGRSPRPVEGLDTLGALEVLDALTVRAHAWRVAGHRYVWPEYGAYVGWGALALAGAGLLVAWRRGHLERIAFLLLFVAVVMGDRSDWWPWPLLRRLPVYDSLRVPSRFLVFVTMEIALLAALGADGLLGRSAEAAGAWIRRIGFGVVAVGATVLALDLLHVNGETADLFREPPLSGAPGKFHLVGGAQYSRSYASFPARELGTPACYEGLIVRPPRGLRVGDVAQARVLPAGAGEVRETGRTRDLVRLDVDLHRPATVVLNQAFDPDWTTSSGEIETRAGLLAISLPAGRRTVRAAYEPWTVLPATALSLAGWIAIAWLLVRRGSGARHSRGGGTSLTVP